MRIHRHGQEFERDGGALLQGAQSVEQHITVLAAAHGHHHLVALFDHGKVRDRLRRLSNDPLRELLLRDALLVALVVLEARGVLTEERIAFGKNGNHEALSL